jgi:polyisoprenyl-teichoic acid--peptidoglycan teichoic acid transferase
MLAVKVMGFVLLLAFGAALGAGAFIMGRFYKTDPISGLIQGLTGFQAMDHPEKHFPGKTRINILCLGLDRNIIKSRNPEINGMPSTKDARSDVMMIASVDFAAKTISVLSVPRDTRVKLPRLDYYAKINEAHSRGGIGYTIDTVSQFLGIDIDHHVVIKQEAIQKVVDSLGGLKLKVANDMDYDDNWGQLHVHLKQGEYTLNGEQVVGFMRFRHDPEGDFGRIRRQQQVIQQLSDQVTSPKVIFKALGLIDVVDKYVRTDLSKPQQIALGHLAHKVGQANISTLSLPVADTATINGISYVIADEDKKEAAVDWIVRGNPDALNRLVRVEIKNASGDRSLYDRVYDCLRHYGFDVVRGGRTQDNEFATSRVVQRTNLRGAARRVLETLGITGDVQKVTDEGEDVTLYIGKDLATNEIVQNSEMWPEMPERKVTFVPRSTERRRTRGRRDRSVRVRSEPEAEAAAEEEGPEPEPEMEIPGAAESGPSTPAPEPQSEPAPAPEPTSPAPSSSTPKQPATPKSPPPVDSPGMD